MNSSREVDIKDNIDCDGISRLNDNNSKMTSSNVKVQLPPKLEITDIRSMAPDSSSSKVKVKKMTHKQKTSRLLPIRKGAKSKASPDKNDDDPFAFHCSDLSADEADISDDDTGSVIIPSLAPNTSVKSSSKVDSDNKQQQRDDDCSSVRVMHDEDSEGALDYVSDSCDSDYFDDVSHALDSCSNVATDKEKNTTLVSSVTGEKSRTLGRSCSDIEVISDSEDVNVSFRSEAGRGQTRDDCAVSASSSSNKRHTYKQRAPLSDADMAAELKKEFCVFCRKDVLWLQHHIKMCHADQPIVTSLLDLPSNTPDHNRLLRQVRQLDKNSL